MITITADAAMYCPDCATAIYGDDLESIDTPDREGNSISPIFGYQTGDLYSEHCDCCGAELMY